MISVIPVIVLLIWISIQLYILNDWDKHAANRRDFWLIILVFTGLIGYIFFYQSSDRR